ncbi:MAG TPA: EBSC protein [Firmicutes bacterium]|nr:EBSC protein [Bacillota bacterium]
MSLSKVKEHLSHFGLEDNIIELEKSSATVKEAALALGTEEAQIAKTLSFYVDNKPILIVLKGDAKIDNAKYKSVFKTKCHMIPATEVEAAIGHSIGGVCPFGINAEATVYLDESLKEFETVYPAAGTSNSAVKLTIEELKRSSNYKEWIDVSK